MPQFTSIVVVSFYISIRNLWGAHFPTVSPKNIVRLWDFYPSNSSLFFNFSLSHMYTSFFHLFIFIILAPHTFLLELFSSLKTSVRNLYMDFVWLGILCASWIWNFMCFNSEKLSTIIYLNSASPTFSLLSSSGTPK